MKAIGFDFDGTLIFSEADKANAFAEAYYKLYGKRNVKQYYKKLVGKYNREDKIRKVIEKYESHKPSDQEVTALSGLFSDTYIKKLTTCPLVKCMSLIEDLKKQVDFVFIVSLEQKKEVIELAKHCGIYHYFDEILGGPESKCENFSRVMNVHGYKPEEMLYIGDHMIDVRVPKKLGIQSIAVNEKLRLRTLLRMMGAKQAYPSLCEIPFENMMR